MPTSPAALAGCLGFPSNSSSVYSVTQPREPSGGEGQERGGVVQTWSRPGRSLVLQGVAETTPEAELSTPEQRGFQQKNPPRTQRGETQTLQ